MRAESFDFLANLDTITAIFAGAVLATGGGLLATWVERHIERRQRERNAALFFGEILSTLDVLVEFAVQARGIGDPYGPITLRMLRGARREIEIYDRNRESLFFLRNGHLRARIHTLMLRLSMPLDSVFDFTQEIAMAQAYLKALGPDDPDRAQALSRLTDLGQRRDSSFDFVAESATQLKVAITDLEPIAHESFRQLAQAARS
ncbi:MAG TPA: hypothetical protein VL026_12215 [Rhizomicrobium sp.]|nr:hypothetical protein [Rhizomicrobium sp.]